MGATFGVLFVLAAIPHGVAIVGGRRLRAAVGEAGQGVRSEIGH
jgi:hypothetical protein